MQINSRSRKQQHKMTGKDNSLTEQLDTEVIGSTNNIMNQGERVDARRIVIAGRNLHALLYGEPVGMSQADHDTMREYFQSH